MKIDVNGIIIWEKNLTENNKVINILTREMGIISAFIKNSKNRKYNNRQFFTEIFMYCKFNIYVAKNGYIINDFEIKERFFEIRNDLKCLALAQYFSQLTLSLYPDKEISSEFLRVILNCLFYLSNKKRDLRLIKCIFELRTCSLCGYAPMLVSCSSCKLYNADKMYFSSRQGKLFCSKCIDDYTVSFADLINSSVLSTLRHIVYSSLENLFNFAISDSNLNNLSKITEKYVKIHVSDNFKALDFFNHLLDL